MSEVADALKSEYEGKFLKAEGEFRDRTAEAYNNTGSQGFEWYAQGPAKEHEFSRSVLDSAISRSNLAPDRMAKNAADQIASVERAFRMRQETRIGMLVRARVRQDQIKLSCELSKQILENELA